MKIKRLPWWRIILGFSSFAIALFLLGISVYGLFIPWRSPLIYSLPSLPPQKPVLTYEQALTQIKATQNKPTKEQVADLTVIIDKAMYHGWDPVYADALRLRIPWYKNYLMYTASYIKPNIYGEYEFCTPYIALLRGVGLCSEQAIILTGILESRHIPTHIVYLNGHIVTEVEVATNPETWWIADPDFGVVMPYSLHALETNPQLIRPYYGAIGYDKPLIDGLVRIYGGPGHKVFADGVYSYTDCSPLKTYVREISFVGIWVIPLVLIGFVGWLLEIVSWPRRR